MNNKKAKETNLKKMIKKILLNLNLLDETIAEKRCSGNQIQTLKSNDNTESIQLTRNSFDDADLDNLAMKLQAIILNNEEFINQSNSKSGH